MNDQLASNHAPAIIGPHLLGFMPDISLEEREDILYATGFAFDATLKANLEGKPALPDGKWKPNLEDPFRYHRNQLRYLGWDTGQVGVLPAIDLGKPFEEQILRDIDTVGLPGNTNAVADAMDALKQNSHAQSVFEQHAYERNGLSFQIMVNNRISRSRLAVLLYCRRYRVRKQVSQFLFCPQEGNFSEASSQFEVVNFNLAAYRQSKRDLVAARMKKISAAFLVDMAQGFRAP